MRPTSAGVDVFVSHRATVMDAFGSLAVVPEVSSAGNDSPDWPIMSRHGYDCMLPHMTLKGSCMCGAVAFAVDEPFAAFPYCHCSRCRKRTGSAHAANAFVPIAQFRWLRGEANVKRWDLEGTRWTSAFCSTCGCSAPWLNRTGTNMVVPTGSLVGEMTERPRSNIHFASRAPWYVHASELTTYDELPPRT